MKKAYELSILCDAQAFVGVLYEGRLHCYSTVHQEEVKDCMVDRLLDRAEDAVTAIEEEEDAQNACCDSKSQDDTYTLSGSTSTGDRLVEGSHQVQQPLVEPSGDYLCEVGDSAQFGGTGHFSLPPARLRSDSFILDSRCNDQDAKWPFPPVVETQSPPSIWELLQNNDSLELEGYFGEPKDHV
ncbi:hypothetical protein HOP50_12g66200 [Chloropicon primus]|uniref:Uncharacterized protein n=1 Tax=Chloropicon primus TaxID=1764295 RepID=A0A5B8MU90_9CHLO|nr:hypothetical protein A3770_12p66010 [Chloropicon primus]UPR03291.1 hypothetical protein HOP50_12g66200 [Chloropicon primus]|eukprot:QDZ24083.1 hypothetical protein A3770_12p66010 [Chloropicon primus]